MSASSETAADDRPRRLLDTPEDAAFRGRLREWLEANNTPIGRSDWGARRQWQAKLCEAGWLGLSWPTEFGGQGGTMREEFIYNEEVARANAPEALNTIGLLIAGPAMIACGDPGQNKHYLPRILSADDIWCQGFSEPNAGSDLANLQTRAVSGGDDYVVSGQKIWTSYSRIADYCLLLVRTAPDRPRHKGITALIVDMKSPGVSVKPLPQITGEAEFGEIFFDDVRVPKKNVVGEENEGWIVAMKTFTRERANISIRSSVQVQRAVQSLIASAAERDEKLDSSTRRKIARAYIDSEALRLNCERFGERLYGFHSSMVKVSWALTNQRVNELGLDTLGPEAVLLDDPEDHSTWQFGYLRSRGNSIEGGTSEILRTIVAERILGLPRK